MKTSQILANMLVENTWIAMCDSGWESNRHRQRNKGKTLSDRQNEPKVEVEINWRDTETWEYIETDGEWNITFISWGYDSTQRQEIYSDKEESKSIEFKGISYTISVFHYLNDQLETDELCDEYNNMDCDDRDGEYYGVSSDQQERLDDMWFELDHSFNTYNGNCFLSQTVQATVLDRNDEKYILVQIHNGADVRGGYTDAKLFKLAWDYLSPQTVYWHHNDHSVDNTYTWYSITDENCQDVEMERWDTLELDWYREM